MQNTQERALLFGRFIAYYYMFIIIIILLLILIIIVINYPPNAGVSVAPLRTLHCETDLQRRALRKCVQLGVVAQLARPPRRAQNLTNRPSQSTDLFFITDLAASATPVTHISDAHMTHIPRLLGWDSCSRT
jgi:hypothetical protein